MKPSFSNHSKPATAALEAALGSSKSGNSGLSLQQSFQANHMHDLFDAVRSDNDLAFPSIAWDFSDEEESQDNHHSMKPAPFAVHRRRSLGCDFQRTNNLRAMARSKTLRTSISSLGNPATQHLSRHV